MLPTTQPESAPFLLVRPASEDRVEGSDADETLELPPVSSRSVAPHAPPPRTATSDGDLPSVIVDLRDLHPIAEEEEEQRASDVDVLLAEADMIASCAPTLPMERRGARGRALGIAMLLVVAVAGGAVAGLRAHGVSARAVGAALHLAR